MSGDYVSRDYLLGEYDRQHQGPPGGARKIIAKAPAADVVEVRHGRWIHEPGHIPHCSECGRYSDDADTGEAICCPFCGAKMDGGQDDE